MKKILLTFGLLIVGAGFVAWYFSYSDYYEYSASSADECVEGELYDEEYQVCYFDFYCETDEECEEVDKRYQSVLSSLADAYASDDFSEVQVDQTGSVLPVEGIIRRLLPQSYLRYITNISEDSDGPDEVLAYVEPIDDLGKEWNLAYDPVDTYTSEGKYLHIQEVLTTFVHELGHIIMLNDSQVAHIVDGDIKCAESEIVIDEGCAQSNSYIKQFIDEYWTDDNRERVFAAEQEGNDISVQLYDESPDAYVSEYAATNEIEDMAESFAFFVMRERVDDGTLASDKINFYYAYPELVELRKYMRAGVASILSK